MMPMQPITHRRFVGSSGKATATATLALSSARTTVRRLARSRIPGDQEFVIRDVIA